MPSSLRSATSISRFPRFVARNVLQTLLVVTFENNLATKFLLKLINAQESNNLTNQSSYRYSGLIHRKNVGIVDTPDKKGFTVVYKKAKAVNKPAKATVRSTMKAGARRSLYKLKTLLTKNKYRVDLTKVCESIVTNWSNSILVLTCYQCDIFCRLHCDELALCYNLRNPFLLKRRELPRRPINLYTLLNICFNIIYYGRHIL